MSDRQLAYAPGETAADLMLRQPKTLAADATVREVRAVLDNPHVQLVLLADGVSFAAAITHLPEDADPDAPARDFAAADVEVLPPETPAAETFARTDASPYRRVVVVDERGLLLGLLCLNASRTGFCRTASRSG